MSQRKNGIHFYIAITNLADIVETEQDQNRLGLVFARIDHYFTDLGNHVNQMKQVYGTYALDIEKLSGSRVHFIITGEPRLAKEILQNLMEYSFATMKELNTLRANDHLPSFVLNGGVDYGTYIDSVFDYYNTKVNIKEKNSMGIPANRAAKIQDKARDGEILISKEAYDYIGGLEKGILLDDGDDRIVTIKSRYPNIKCYSLKVESWRSTISSQQVIKNNQREFQHFRDSLSMVKPFQLRILDEQRAAGDLKEEITGQPRRFSGFVLYSDIRHSTKTLEMAGDHIEEVSERFNHDLREMVNATQSHDLTHVQIQGDREAVCSLERTEKALVQAILCGFELSDAIRRDGVKKDFPTGVGLAIGGFYASRVGNGDYQDTLILGKTVNLADEAEDTHASQDNEFAMTKEVYDETQRVHDVAFRSAVRECFAKDGPDFYVTTKSRQDFESSYRRRQTSDVGPQAEEEHVRPWGE